MKHLVAKNMLQLNNSTSGGRLNSTGGTDGSAGGPSSASPMTFDASSVTHKGSLRVQQTATATDKKNASDNSTTAECKRADGSKAQALLDALLEGKSDL